MNEPPKPPEILDFYELLNLSEFASSSEIERRCKELQVAYHPDSRRTGARPSTVLFQNVGIAWDTLKSNRERRRYNRDYPRIRDTWNLYRIRLGAWEAEQRENARRQARLLERQRKIVEEEAALEKEQARKLEERAAKAAKQRFERAKAEEARHEEQALRLRERLHRERRRRGLAQVKQDARLKSDWRMAQNKRNVTENDSASQEASDKAHRLRERWRLKHDLTREQSRKAEHANTLAAEKRLRQQEEQEEEQRSKAEDDQGVYKEAQRSQHESERRAAKQRAAEEREREVIAAAHERQTRAAQDRLRHQQWSSQAVKQPVPDDVEDNQAPKRPKQGNEISPSLRKHMAREHARRKHSQRLMEVGGPGNEHRLRDEIIDLGWLHEEYRGEACPQCNAKRTAALFGLWRCPEGGALRCRPCLVALSTFGA